MANNRMMLMHRPTGLAVFLGKNSGWSWCGTPDDIEEKLAQLFERVERECENGDQMDDFCLAMESCHAPNPIVNLEWDGYYEEDGGFLRLYRNDSERKAEIIIPGLIGYVEVARYCCDAWHRAEEDNTCSEGIGPMIWRDPELYGDELSRIGNIGSETELPPLKYCPWCGAKKG